MKTHTWYDVTSYEWEICNIIDKAYEKYGDKIVNISTTVRVNSNSDTSTYFIWITRRVPEE